MPETSSLYSHHIFIFPFKWDLNDGGPDFSDRTDLQRLENRIGKNPAVPIPSSGLKWKRHHFDWSTDYSEAIYFHAHVRDVLFDNEDDGKSSVLQYHISVKEKLLYYDIHLKKNPGPYRLRIDEITLNYYDTGIGFFAFHLNNFSHRKPKNILEINDFGRRIYPQFLGKDDDRLSAPKGAFLADRIEIVDNLKVLTGDDFTSIPAGLGKKSQSADELLLPDYIKLLLPKTARPSASLRMNPLLDDRMHVICWVGDKSWLEDLSKSDWDSNLAFHWYSYIFVDDHPKSGMHNTHKLKEYIQNHTYQRWTDDGLYYGISRYSFVILANGDDWFHSNIVLKHLQTMYFQLVLLSLLQRGSIVRFSEEITRLSRELSSGKQLKRSTQAVQSLYARYLEFVNKIYFREVTPQEQGIELYQMIQKNMEIERDVKSLQTEIHDFFNLLELRATEQQSDAMNTLTVIGSGLLVPSLILAYYGVSAFPEICDKIGFSYVWTPRIAVAGMILGLLSAWIWVRVRGHSITNRWIAALVILFVFIALFWAVVYGPLLYFEIKNDC